MTDKADPCGSDSSAELGPLPEPYTRQWINAPFTERLLFSEEQMRFYAAAEIVCALRKERERLRNAMAAVWDEGFNAGNDWRQSVTEFWSDHSSGRSPPAPKNPWA